MQVAKRSADFTARKFPFIFEPQNSTKTTNWTWDALFFSLVFVFVSFSRHWLWLFKSFLNLLGVDRFFVLIF